MVGGLTDIRRAGQADLPAFLALLEAVRLPTADIASIDQLRVWVLEEHSAMVGAVALERFGSEALLRSLVVAPGHRQRGLGRALVSKVEESARAENLDRLVLLTETAEAFFRGLGYRIIDRQSVGESLQQSAEFRSLCPASARCMSKDLTTELQEPRITTMTTQNVPVTIYHNPACGTSRNTLALIRNADIEPTIIEYLKTPPGRDTLLDLLRRMGMRPRELLRQKGTPYAELGLQAEHWTDDALVDQMLTHPILINRPIVITPWGVKLCRPSEVVLEILPVPQKGPFVKEDGERVLDERGRRIR